MRVLRLFLVLFLLPMAGHAKWFESSSDHFVVYADDREKNVRRFSQQLEQYHKALTILTQLSPFKPSPSNRVTVFVVKSRSQVKKLFGDGGRAVAGFYIPRASGSIAIVSRVKANNISMNMLMHEYVHHFMISNSEIAAPKWVSEGGAEFFSAAKFERDGSLTLGLPATHRFSGLLTGSKITVKELLDPQTYGSLSSRGLDSFYGRSWLLYHYLKFSKSRKGQLNEYQHQISLGQNSLAAGKTAFGDFGKLDRELRSYLKSRKLTGLSIRKEALTIGNVAVRQLREGEAKMMDVRMRSRRGVNPAGALELVVKARKIAERYPDDPAVQSALAEAEFIAGNDAAAIIASNLALAKDDKDVNAYVQKGYALFRQAREAKDQATAYKKAIAPFLALNKIENDHPLPLMYNHRRFVAQKKAPSKNAIEGLERALELAPFDRGLRFRVALQQIKERRYDWAERNLSALAFDPHGGKLSRASQEVLKRLRGDKELDPSELIKILKE